MCRRSCGSSEYDLSSRDSIWRRSTVQDVDRSLIYFDSVGIEADWTGFLGHTPLGPIHTYNIMPSVLQLGTHSLWEPLYELPCLYDLYLAVNQRFLCIMIMQRITAFRQATQSDLFVLSLTCNVATDRRTQFWKASIDIFLCIFYLN